MLNETEYHESPFAAEAAGQFPESVLYRIAKGDAKGRSYGTPRNPRAPTIEEFNPRLADIRAGDFSKIIVGRRHGIFLDQAQRIAQLSNEEIVVLQMQDPISGTWQNGLSLTGGHHRANEIIQRVQGGQMDPGLLIRVLIHD